MKCGGRQVVANICIKQSFPNMMTLNSFFFFHISFPLCLVFSLKGDTFTNRNVSHKTFDDNKGQANIND